MPEISEGTKGVVVATLFPVGLMAVGMAAQYKEMEAMKKWWEGLNKPKCMPNDMRAYFAVDTAVILPLGCASYLVYKEGGCDNADVKLALGVYAGHLLTGLAFHPLMKKRDLKGMFVMSVVYAGGALATAALFYRVKDTAGKMVTPYAIWMLCYTGMLGYLAKHNTSPSTDAPPPQ